MTSANDDVKSRLSSSLVDRYRIIEAIGAGGMATVFRADDLKHHRQVAIKVLHPELGEMLGANRFLSEIRTTANLQHPHILPLHDSGEADGLLFYVMPLIDGETLRERLTKERQLPLGDAIRIARDVAAALSYAHKRGVVHRDIKPENIFLQEQHAFVADFGIAIAMSSVGGQRLTQTGISLGTPQYMSPEQALGERAIDARTDVYALACVMYEMLTGSPPYTGASAQVIIGKAIQGPPSPPSDVRPSIPPEIDAAILDALSQLPADRTASADAFASAISASPTAVTARRTGAAKVTTRKQWQWPAVAGILAIIGATGWLQANKPSRTAGYLGPTGCEPLDGVWRHADTSIASGTWITHNGVSLEVIFPRTGSDPMVNRWRFISCSADTIRSVQLESNDSNPVLRTGAEIKSPYRLDGDIFSWKNPRKDGGYGREYRGERVR